jgi:antitoxin (DNA-binding transcriptional repressor) of toxin-antitoxin stability system
MEYTVRELRYNTRKIVQALGRGKPITLLYRGKPLARISSLRKKKPLQQLQESPAFGIWKSRTETPEAMVNRLRSPRFS